MSLQDRYARYKALAIFYYVQRIKGFEVPADPHLDEAATVALQDHLSRSRFYLEFGSGGSTLMADRLGVETVSVDSDRYFAKAVRKALSIRAPVKQIYADIGFTQEWGNPVWVKQTKARLKRWRRYIELPFAEIQRRGRMPDFVLIDGRFRVGCALETARRAAQFQSPVLIMMDDYAERPHYHVVEKSLGKPSRAGRAALFKIEAPYPNISQAMVANMMADIQ